MIDEQYPSTLEHDDRRTNRAEASNDIRMMMKKMEFPNQ